MEFNEEIMKKVVQRERKVGYFDRCLKARICPACGGHLDHDLAAGYVYPDELFECQSCKFTHRKG